jgi:hypothetical protein
MAYGSRLMVRDDRAQVDHSHQPLAISHGGGS